MSTFCLRNLNNYLIDLDRLNWSMCCHTPWRAMQAGEDWFNGQVMTERRQQHSSDQRHSDCTHCWRLEDAGQLSSRQTESNTQPRLEIKISNTCDMACRYCRPNSSSIWAERMREFGYSKKALLAEKQTPRHQAVTQEFITWLQKELPRFTQGRGLLFTGGEPFLDDRFYSLLESLDIRDTKIHINTNLNTPQHLWSRQTDLITHLINHNNRVYLRCSIDGVGAQQEWQRQGSSWDRLQANWYRLGQLPLQMFASLTVTPLTLESMCSAGEFVKQSHDKLCRKPMWLKSAMVTWPRHWDASSWFPLFHQEITHMLQLVNYDSDVAGAWNPTEQMTSWMAVKGSGPSKSETQLLAQHLDEAEQKYGGGSWRMLYPKVAEIVAS